MDEMRSFAHVMNKGEIVRIIQFGTWEDVRKALREIALRLPEDARKIACIDLRPGEEVSFSGRVVSAAAYFYKTEKGMKPGCRLTIEVPE